MGKHPIPFLPFPFHCTNIPRAKRFKVKIKMKCMKFDTVKSTYDEDMMMGILGLHGFVQEVNKVLCMKSTIWKTFFNFFPPSNHKNYLENQLHQHPVFNVKVILHCYIRHL